MPAPDPAPRIPLTIRLNRVRPPREAWQRAIQAIPDPQARAQVIREELAAAEAFLLAERAEAARQLHRKTRNWAEVGRRLPPGPDGRAISRQRAHRIADGEERGVYSLTRPAPTESP